MRKAILGFLGLLAFALPQAASAQSQNFGANNRYSAKFLCGDASGGDSRLGVVEGHYNTIVNVTAIRNVTAFAYRATALRSDFEIDDGEPSGFSRRFDFDADGGIGVLCRDIKDLLGVGGNTGFIEGFVTIYASKPLNVTDVLTAEGGDTDIRVMQVYQVIGRSASGTIRPPAPEL